ncbi:MAG: type IX secretion system membrane protein PorP/SprF [Bacteroidia bacterium]
MKKTLAYAFMVLGILTLFHTRGIAQDPQYSQFYANQVMLNPAFTGTAKGYRLALNYRGQWVNVPGYYKQMAASVDMPLFIGRTTQGIGLTFTSDVAGEGNLARRNILLSYSFMVPLADDHTLMLGLSGGIQQASIDFFKLRFPDQINPRTGFVNQTMEPGTSMVSPIRPDINAGVAYFNNYAFVGFSAEHLTEPKQRFYTDGNVPLPKTIDARLPRKYTLTGGMRIPLGDFRDPDKLSITPAFLVKMQRQFFQFDAGAYLNIEPMVFGVWYRHQDAVIGLLGFRKGFGDGGTISFGYSYDYTISSLTQGVSGGSHELSLLLEFEKDRPRRFKHRDLPCPKF